MKQPFITALIIDWQDSRGDLGSHARELISLGWQPTGDVFRDDEGHYCLQYVKYGRRKF